MKIKTLLIRNLENYGGYSYIQKITIGLGNSYYYAKEGGKVVYIELFIKEPNQYNEFISKFRKDDIVELGEKCSYKGIIEKLKNLDYSKYEENEENMYLDFEHYFIESYPPDIFEDLNEDHSDKDWKPWHDVEGYRVE